MEQLFLTGGVPPERPLLRLQERSLAELVEKIGPKSIITFSERGRKVSQKDLFRGKGDEDVCAIVGGFPRGDFRSEIDEISDKIISIYPGRLEALTVVAHAIQFYEEELGVLKGSLPNPDE